MSSAREFNVSDSADFDVDVRLIASGAEALSSGVHALSIMYDEHSPDQKSQENIHGYAESLRYRINALAHIASSFRDDFERSQEWVLSAHQTAIKEHRSFYPRMPHLHRAEELLTVHIDSLVFHSLSAFDYAGHMLLYMAKTVDKEKTKDWDALHQNCNLNNGPLRHTYLAKTVRRVGDNYVKRLDEYRNRLIHKEKDHHTMHIVYDAEHTPRTIMRSSDRLMQSFRKVFKHQGDYSTKIFITSIVSKSMIELANVLLAMSKDIQRDSHFINNIRKPKGNKSFSLVLAGPEGRVRPVSEPQWQGHRTQIEKFAELAGLSEELDKL